MAKQRIQIAALTGLCQFLLAASAFKESDRDSKLLPIFQIVRFPNRPCEIAGGAKNGTCYTQEECTSNGGTSGGSCAQGFGVCCIFTMGCGQTFSQNCTYFEASNLKAGACRSKICKCSSDICQMRLDFNSFAITGPSTLSLSVGLQANGQQAAAGKKFNYASNCLTDIFSISNAPNVPRVCGDMQGEHVYFDAADACHDLGFALGQNAVGTTIPTRTFSIKITQYPCNYINLAPPGCTQYYFGMGGTGSVKSFNYNNGFHLAEQNQRICVRKEAGFCRICWTAAAATDVQLGGKNTKGVVKGESCCGYGTNGMKSTGVYDCIMIPGAIKSDNSLPVPVSQCGGMGGIVTASGTTPKTVCSRDAPFRLNFVSDTFELAETAADAKTKGFKVIYLQKTCP